ncbi:MAG: family 20 glycosylhydrolase [Thomasclavelia sp.]
MTDDQGWRLEIKGERYGESYEKLLTIGAQSSCNGDPGGYYTQEEYKDIVDYAAQRYIEIVPEFDMPGHTGAALASLDFLSPMENLLMHQHKIIQLVKQHLIAVLKQLMNLWKML